MSETKDHKDVVLKPDAPKELLRTLHASYIHGWEADKGGYEYVMSEYLRMSGQSAAAAAAAALLSSSRFSARTCETAHIRRAIPDRCCCASCWK